VYVRCRLQEGMSLWWFRLGSAATQGFLIFFQTCQLLRTTVVRWITSSSASSRVNWVERTKGYMKRHIIDDYREYW